MSYGNGIKLTAGFDVGAKTPLDSKSVVQTIAERDAFVTDNLVYEGLEVYVKDTGHKYRYDGTSWIDLDAQSGSESGTGEGLTTEQANQLTTAYEHSQTPHVSADDIPTNISDLTNDSGFITSSDLPTVPTKVSDLENDRGYLISIPEEYITETELEAKGYLTSHQDISNLQSKTDNNLATTSKEVVGAINEVKSSVDGITVPAKTSDLTNDSGFITSIPAEYITETELETKGYLTEHQSLTDYAKKTDIPDVSDFLTEVPEGYVTDTKLSTELDKKVNKEAGKGLSTNDLTNELVTKINSSATEAFVTNAIANAQLGGKEVDLSGYATIDALNLKADLTHTHDQYLTKVPDEYITETELTDKNYADKTYVTQAVKNVKVDLTGYAKTSDIPTKVSDLTNDSNFITSIPEEYITETELEAKGYLTSHQDISNLALKSEIPDVSSFITSDDLPTVPTKVSDLANDKNYISSIPSEYITETELTAKKYLTSVPSTYALKTDIPTVPTKTSDLTNDSGFIGYPDVIVINKGSLDAEVDLDNDISIGKNVTLLTGTIAQIPYDNELVYIDKRSSTSMYIYNMKGNKLFVMKSGGAWFQVENVNFIYPTDTINSLTTSAKTVPGAIDELRRGLNGIKVPTKTSDLTNDSGFITSIPSEYVTETELNAKGYLTSHQDISGLQTKTDKNLTTTSKEVVGAINELKTNISNINTGGGSSFSGSYNDLTDKPTIPTKTSDLNNDSGFIGYPDVIVINKGNSEAEVNLDNDIPLGNSTVLLTGRIVSIPYEHELVSIYRDEGSPNGFVIYSVRGSKVNVSKSNGNWKITSNTSFIYSDSAKALYQRITDNTLTTTAKTIPTAINELKSGLDGIKVPTKTSELTNNSGFITTIPDEYITETELNAKGYLTSHQDISNLQSKTDNNLVTTSKEVVGAINEVKSLNDTKLNKTDANKLNCVSIDNGSLKEYILTNCTETGKTYYLIAKTTCTDLPKASNFYITVETPGMYTYKVTAKELNDSNGIYVCTYRTISSSWTAWEKVCTTTVADVPNTPITSLHSNVTDGKVFYQVKNGICYVDMISLSISTVESFKICEGLPKCDSKPHCILVSGNASIVLGLVYKSTGDDALWVNMKQQGIGYGSFSYPVADS